MMKLPIFILLMLALVFADAREVLNMQSAGGRKNTLIIKSGTAIPCSDSPIIKTVNKQQAEAFGCFSISDNGDLTINRQSKNLVSLEKTKDKTGGVCKSASGEKLVFSLSVREQGQLVLELNQKVVLEIEHDRDGKCFDVTDGDLEKSKTSKTRIEIPGDPEGKITPRISIPDNPSGAAK